MKFSILVFNGSFLVRSAVLFKQKKKSIASKKKKEENTQKFNKRIRFSPLLNFLFTSTMGNIRKMLQYNIFNKIVFAFLVGWWDIIYVMYDVYIWTGCGVMCAPLEL